MSIPFWEPEKGPPIGRDNHGAARLSAQVIVASSHVSHAQQTAYAVRSTEGSSGGPTPITCTVHHSPSVKWTESSIGYLRAPDPGLRFGTSNQSKAIPNAYNDLLRLPTFHQRRASILAGMRPCAVAFLGYKEFDRVTTPTPPRHP